MAGRATAAAWPPRDEPTGELDRATGRAILDLFRAMWRDGLTLVVVTHDEQLAAEAGRRIVLRDGRIAESAGR